MANYVQVEKVTAVTANGPKTLYNIEVIDKETGQTVEKKTTASMEEAQAAYLASHLEQLGTAGDAAAAAAADDDGDGYPDSLKPVLDAAKVAADAADPAGNETGIPADDPVSFQPGTSAPPPDPGSLSTTSVMAKQARDLCGMASTRKKEFLRLTEDQRIEQKISGVFGNKRVQAMAARENAPSDVVVGRGIDNNAFIIIGNDRPGKLHEGYGGKGHTQSDCIDLVAGLGGPCVKEVEKRETKTLDGKEVLVDLKTTINPNFFLDAARIYISQKTDIDKNFGLGEFGPSSKEQDQEKDPKRIGKYGAKSAIAAKADNIRIIGRESIQIVTGTDKKNSVGGSVLGKSGIELVAMNKYEELQPMVLGDNLIELLEKIVDKVDKLSKVNNGTMKYQMKLNQALQHHTHASPFFGIQTLPSAACLAAGVQCDLEMVMNSEISTVKNLTNLVGLKMNYLVDSGEKFINSRLNKCN